MSKTRSAAVESIRRTLAKPIEIDALLAKASQKDRTNLEKHMAAIDAQHSATWQRLMRSLATLSPLAITTVGQQAVQFFIADGKYRMQVFALEDQHDGLIVVYIPDVLAEALKLKIISTDTVEGLPDRYAIVGSKSASLHIEQLSGPATPNPAPYYKNMLGWNRKALRIPVPVTFSDDQLEAVEDIAGLASRAWVEKAEKAERAKEEAAKKV